MSHSITEQNCIYRWSLKIFCTNNSQFPTPRAIEAVAKVISMKKYTFGLIHVGIKPSLITVLPCAPHRICKTLQMLLKFSHLLVRRELCTDETDRFHFDHNKAFMRRCHIYLQILIHNPHSDLGMLVSYPSTLIVVSIGFRRNQNIYTALHNSGHSQIVLNPESSQLCLQ